MVPVDGLRKRCQPCADTVGARSARCAVNHRGLADPAARGMFHVKRGPTQRCNWRSSCGGPGGEPPQRLMAELATGDLDSLAAALGASARERARVDGSPESRRSGEHWASER